MIFSVEHREIDYRGSVDQSGVNSNFVVKNSCYFTVVVLQCIMFGLEHTFYHRKEY